MREAIPVLPPVVDESFVLAHLDELMIVDTRWYLDGRSGQDAYLAGHLPGAVFADLSTELAAPPSAAAGRHPLPSAPDLAAALGQLGIADTTETVAYDDQGGTVAARLVWMLRALGRSSALLDGGIGAWGGDLEIGEVRRPPVTFTARDLPTSLVADIEDAAAPGDALLIDARDPTRYRGDGDPIDPRTGHIPGALSVPCRENLDGDGRFLPPDRLRERFVKLGIDGTREVISYCGSGVTACHNLLALELAGLGRGRLYPGSWSQWSSDATRNVATGDGPPAEATSH